MTRHHRRGIFTITAGALVGVGLLAGWSALPGPRSIETDLADVRHQITGAGAVDQMPGSELFTREYLGDIIGHPGLLDAVLGTVAESPDVQAKQIVAVLITWRVDEDEAARAPAWASRARPPEDDATAEWPAVRDVAILIQENLRPGDWQPTLLRDAYFESIVDPKLAFTGHSLLYAASGHTTLLASNEATLRRHQAIHDEIREGLIDELADYLGEEDAYFIQIFPNVRRLATPQLRRHLERVTVGGKLGVRGGDTRTEFLTRSDRSAQYTRNVIEEMIDVAQITLETQWGGAPRRNPWNLDQSAGPSAASLGGVTQPFTPPGPDVITGETRDNTFSSFVWWSFEMVGVLEGTEPEVAGPRVWFDTEYTTVQLNAVLKSIERASRDLAQMRKSMIEKKDPRLVDAELWSGQPLNYWSPSHREGPHWPLAPRPYRRDRERSDPDESPAGVQPPGT